MNITFILPGIPNRPIGGFKIIFEYANRLTIRGYKVNILFECSKNLMCIKNLNFIRKILSNILIYYYPKWFNLNKNIVKKCIFEINNNSVPDSDIIVATSVRTSTGVFNLDKKKGKKIYFIQDFECWKEWTPEMVCKTYSLGMKNIVIANWLKKIVDKYSIEKSILIRNGIDFNIYNIDIPIEKRNKYTISMLYHIGEHKGCKYGIQTLILLKKIYPQLIVNMFGVVKSPKNIPKWINYIYKPDSKKLRTIYNNSAIFICSSIKEGFGLTGAESMACGCAYVSTDYGGVREYTIDNENVLLSLPKDVEALKKNIQLLIENDALRIEMAKNGYKYINKILNWNNSVNAFEKLMK